jgi:hypothetical protein
MLKTNNMSKQTAVQWLQDKYDNCPESFLTEDDFEKAKQMYDEEMLSKYGEGYDEGLYDGQYK